MKYLFTNLSIGSDTLLEGLGKFRSGLKLPGMRHRRNLEKAVTLQSEALHFLELFPQTRHHVREAVLLSLSFIVCSIYWSNYSIISLCLLHRSRICRQTLVFFDVILQASPGLTALASPRSAKSPVHLEALYQTHNLPLQHQRIQSRRLRA